MEFYCESLDTRSTRRDCAVGEVCDAGACVPRRCNDADGQNASIAGETYITIGDRRTESNSDTCAQGDTVREYYCDGSEITSRSIQCPQGASCSGGRCVQPTCTDSDGGIVTSIAGSVVRGVATGNDVCVGQSRTVNDVRMYEQVREYYCGGQQMSSINSSCGQGRVCQEGRCVQAPAGTCPFANTPCTASTRCENYRCVARQIGCVLDTNNIDVSIRAYASFYNGDEYEAIMQNRDLREGQSYSHAWLDWVNSVIVRDITYTVGECTATNVACRISNKRVVLEVDARG